MHIKSLRVLALFTLFFLTFPAYSKPHINVDEFLRTVNLANIYGNNTVLNLGAQTIDPDASTSSIDELNDYVLLGNPASEGGTHAIEFDDQQKIVKDTDLGGPWLGVKGYTQSEIFPLSLQDGLQLVQVCMASKNPPDPTPPTISRVIIYRTLNTNQTVYDYVFKDPDLAPGVCREVIYTPKTNTCQRGFHVNCHLHYDDPISLKQDLLLPRELL